MSFNNLSPDFKNVDGKLIESLKWCRGLWERRENPSDGMSCDNGHSSAQNSTGGVTHNTAKTAKIAKNNTQKIKQNLMLNQTVFCMGLAFTDLLKKFSSPPRPPIEGRAGPPRCTTVGGVWKPIAVAAKTSVFQAWRWMLSDVVHRVYTALSLLHKNVVKLFVFSFGQS